MCKNMRINTDGNQAYREDLYERVADQLGESTKTGAIDAACMHIKQDLRNKEEAMELLAEELPPEQLTEVAEILSTNQITLTVDLETSLKTE